MPFRGPIRRAAGVLALTATALAAAAGVGAATAAPPAPEPLLVQAKPGQLGTALRGLGRSALRVQRREGRQLQVLAGRSQARRIARLAGVASTGPGVASFSDTVPVISQGLDRTGAVGRSRGGRGGEGLVIAILDRGFGRNVGRFQARGELPKPGRLLTRSFDATSGLAGSNAYGNRTNHGELVAQTVYDYAPRANYLFVNYDTRLDFLAAVRWLIQVNPDIVVHSNSFIDGRFDGRGKEADVVNAAAASGILWFNSAGNYARRHWQGAFRDTDGDGEHEWPTQRGLTIFRSAGSPVTYALSWRSPPGGPATDLDIVLERLGSGGVWQEAAASRQRQSSGARETELIVGQRSREESFFRLRVVLAGGPPPSGPMTLFSREIPLSLIGGSPESSQPSPGDAAGAISVGAVDWRGDALKSYSSRGPTDDGRAKPDLVAPTDTAVAGLSGRRGVGGTSNAAPNAAGAAALLLAALRRQGLDPSPTEMRALLQSLALDLGVEGVDSVFGAGRVRVDTRAPHIARLRPRPLSSARRVTKLEFTATSRNRLLRWGLSIDGKPLGGRRNPAKTRARFDTRRLKDGWHLLRVEARDWAGNQGVREWPVRVDNTRPRLRVAGVSVRGPGKRRAAAARVRVTDKGTRGRLRARATITRRGGSTQVRRLAIPPNRAHRARLGRFGPGRYLLELVVTDPAGNTATARRSFIVR